MQGSAGPRAEILGKVGERAHDRIGREAAERAQRTKLHGVAEVLEERQVAGAILAAHDAFDRLDTAGCADAAWRTLAAGFECAEFHGEPDRKSTRLNSSHVA